MPSARPIIRSSFESYQDEFLKLGKRPVVFDILAPDRRTSLLPDGLKMVLHTNPNSMQFSHTKVIERTQTLGGWVEAHWGAAPAEISMTATTGGFVRLHTGLSNITGPTGSNSQILPTTMQATGTGGGRRDSIAYDKYLDLLALFKNNGSIYDINGQIALQGQILVAFDGGAWWGWFSTFSVEETADQPYQFAITAAFTVEREKHNLRTVNVPLVPMAKAGA